MGYLRDFPLESSGDGTRRSHERHALEGRNHVVADEEVVRDLAVRLAGAVAGLFGGGFVSCGWVQVRWVRVRVGDRAREEKEKE